MQILCKMFRAFQRQILLFQERRVPPAIKAFMKQSTDKDLDIINTYFLQAKCLIYTYVKQTLIGSFLCTSVDKEMKDCVVSVMTMVSTGKHRRKLGESWWGWGGGSIWSNVPSYSLRDRIRKSSVWVLINSLDPLISSDKVAVITISTATNKGNELTPNKGNELTFYCYCCQLGGGILQGISQKFFHPWRYHSIRFLKTQDHTQDHKKLHLFVTLYYRKFHKYKKNFVRNPYVPIIKFNNYHLKPILLPLYINPLDYSE